MPIASRAAIWLQLDVVDRARDRVELLGTLARRGGPLRDSRRPPSRDRRSDLERRPLVRRSGIRQRSRGREAGEAGNAAGDVPRSDPTPDSRPRLATRLEDRPGAARARTGVASARRPCRRRPAGRGAGASACARPRRASSRCAPRSRIASLSGGGPFRPGTRPGTGCIRSRSRPTARPGRPRRRARSAPEGQGEARGLRHSDRCAAGPVVLSKVWP